MIVGFNYFLIVLQLLVYFIFFNIIFYKGWHQPEIFAGIEEKVKYKSSGLTKNETEDWARKIGKYMEEEKPYLIPGITIEQLAEKIDIHPRSLSQIINDYFGQNFYDYINKHRIVESKRMLIECTKKTVLEILYEAGFNTKSSFNTCFKKETGLTPTEFRKNALISRIVS